MESIQWIRKINKARVCDSACRMIEGEEERQYEKSDGEIGMKYECQSTRCQLISANSKIAAKLK